MAHELLNVLGVDTGTIKESAERVAGSMRRETSNPGAL